MIIGEDTKLIEAALSFEFCVFFKPTLFVRPFLNFYHLAIVVVILVQLTKDDPKHAKKETEVDNDQSKFENSDSIVDFDLCSNHMLAYDFIFG
jgi:hypothetical protein